MTGLYDPAFEHDACGVAFVATMTGLPSHEIVQQALTALTNLEHRGASGSEPDSGDGAGILIQIPDALFRDVVDFDLPEAGRYAVGTAFLPSDPGEADVAVKSIETIAAEEGLTVLGWRTLPTDDSLVGKTARGTGYGTYYPDWDTLVDGSNTERLCGFSDWRVPTRAELQGLVHYGRTNPAIDTDYFPTTPTASFWSASPDAYSSYGSWAVDFIRGSAYYYYYNRDYYYHVRLVRSGK